MSTSNGKHPPTEVQRCMQGRRFSGGYKRQIVEATAGCEYGERDGLLRPEESYSAYTHAD